MADSNPAEYKFFDDDQLRQDLLKFHVTVSKITDKNREILIKKLNHLRARQRAAEAPPSPSRSPSRQSPGRAKKSTPRRSHVPAAPQFSSSDEDDSAPRAADNVPERQKNLRRRTVDVGWTLSDVAKIPGRTRGMTGVSEQVEEAGKGKRRSLGAAANSSSLAGSVRNPVQSQSGARNGPRLRSVRANDSTYDVEFSGSDDEYTFTEVATAGVNTSPSLYDMADRATASPSDRRTRAAKRKQWTGASGECCNIIY